MTARASGSAPGAALAGLVAAPVVVGLGYSAAAAIGLAGPAARGLSLVHIDRVMRDATVWRGLAWTIYAAALATALATAAAVAVAIGFRGTGIGDRLARIAALVPFPIPYVVAAAGAVLVLGQSGLLARLAAAAGVIHDPSGFPPLVLDRPGLGFILTFAWKEVPFLTFVAVSVLATRGQQLEETARTLGASPAATLRRVTVPLLWRGLAPAVVLVFIFIAGTYEGAALLGPTDPLPFAVATYERYQALDLTLRGDGFVLTLLGLILGLAAVAVFEWTRARAERLRS